MRIIACVRANAESSRELALTLHCLASNALACVRVLVEVAPGARVDREEARTAAGALPISFTTPDAAIAALHEAVRETQACGVLLASAGCFLSHGIDARLAKVAAEDSLVDTVSPWCDRSAAHRLRDAAAPALDAAGIERLDRLAFLCAERSYESVETPLVECCFVSASAIARAAADPRRWPGMADMGLMHVICDAAYADAPSSVGPGAGREVSARAAPLPRSRRSIVEAERSGFDFLSMPAIDARPVQLHVIHDLGGGAAKWLRDYSQADASRVNLVLKSYSHGAAAGDGVALYSHALDGAPLRVWTFREPIAAAAAAHLEYRAALEEIVRRHCVDVVVVSSLIGHSLDALNTGLPTLVVNHDYFPYCPAINLYFDAPCRACDVERIGQCHRDNPRFNPFVDFRPPERARVRERFVDLVAQPNVTMVAPSRSVKDNLLRLDPRFARTAFAEIPHGYHAPPERIPVDPRERERLRVVVLGQLSAAKGVDLLKEALPRITRFADVYLLGSRELGESFRFMPRVHVLSHYEPGDLPRHMANINPHAGLLTSVVPETFSYALSELWMLGVPPAATRLGSFAERIQEGENGYLFEPDAQSLVSKLEAIDSDRAGLAAIRANIAGWRPRAASEMVADYERLAPVAPRPLARYPLGPPGHATWEERDCVNEATLTLQTVTLASMWKDVKSLGLQMSTLSEARQGAESARAEAEAAGARLQDTIAALRHEASGREAQLSETQRQLERVSGTLHTRNLQLAEVYASTSWRVSAPVRWAGRAGRKLAILARVALGAARNPAEVPARAAAITRAWRSGGLHEVKKTMLGQQLPETPTDSWKAYRRAFRRAVRPRIVERIRAMGVKPLISVIVPTYDTPAEPLRQMLDSVRAQLYPAWELCIADDGSRQPHVRQMLEAYAAKDDRIRIDLGSANRGVSHASNRAVAMARGEFVVLLDHDDVLEEQALFRVAESILADDPDMVYSDELLVSADLSTVLRFAYRPAFSPEYLRSHPYIVHLVGFRKSLLREAGGFDEALTISQDYDLILRVAEKARSIVHIPEILYQWRTHEGSAGTRKQDEVMETSKEVLRRHLDRCGEKATVAAGARFNLFDVRYPLREGLRVAIVIPTKNHADLVRQCIESIRATVTDVAYDIVVVDHESDEPGTRQYLASIAPGVRVLRHEGPFNFSAINNRAIAQLGEGYSHYLLCNNDIEAIAPGWLERMLELGQSPSVGIVGAQLLYPDRRSIQHAGVLVGAYGAAEHYAKRLRFPEDPVEAGFAELLLINHEVAAVTAACLLIRKDAFDAVGGFDESIAVGFGDVDLCLRVLQRGYRIVYCPFATLIHHESYTRGTSTRDPHPEDSAIFRLKWAALLEAGDPYHHPALSLTSSNWALRSPLPCTVDIRRRVAIRDPSGRGNVSFSPSSTGA
ncbi:MAG: glycosyltransferase [Usitatibacter sp.]